MLMILLFEARADRLAFVRKADEALLLTFDFYTVPPVLRLAPPAAAPLTLLVLLSVILLDGLEPVYLWLPGRFPLDD